MGHAENYSTVDGVVLTFSKIHKNGIFDEIDFRFERANDKGGFDFAIIFLVEYDDQITVLLDFPFYVSFAV